MLLLELTAACYLLLYQNQVSCVHHVRSASSWTRVFITSDELWPHQVGEMLKKELRDGLEKAKAQNRSSPDVFYEWDLLQNNVRWLMKLQTILGSIFLREHVRMLAEGRV